MMRIQRNITFLKLCIVCCTGEGDRGGERRRGAGAAVSRGMRRRPLLPLLLLALLRAHGLLAASGGKFVPPLFKINVNM